MITKKNLFVAIKSKYPYLHVDIKTCYDSLDTTYYIVLIKTDFDITNQDYMNEVIELCQEIEPSCICAFLRRNQG